MRRKRRALSFVVGGAGALGVAVFARIEGGRGYQEGAGNAGVSAGLAYFEGRRHAVAPGVGMVRAYGCTGD